MSKNNTPMSEWEYQYQREYNRIIQAINRQKKLGYFVPEEVRPLKPSQKKTITPEDVERLIEITPQKIRKSSIYIDKETGEGFQGLDVVNSHHKPKPSEAKIRQPSTHNVEIQTNTQPKQIAPKQPKQIAPKQTKEKTKQSPKQSSEPFTPPKPSAPSTENNLNIQIIQDITERIESFDPLSVGWSSSFKENKKVIKSQLQVLWEDVLDSEGEYEVAYRLNDKAKEINDILDILFYDSDSSRVSFNMSAFITIVLGRSLTQVEADWLDEIAEHTRNIDI